MKIIHLNTYSGNGGAGKACLRLNKALQSQGVDSKVAVNFLFGKDPEVRDLSSRLGFLSRSYTAAGIILERLIARHYTGSRPIPFSVPAWGKDISGLEIIRSADIIHLHWVNHAFLGPAQLAKLARLNKPIVWTFHDSNAFTGGCHVRYDCLHYLEECGNCPVLEDPAPEDISHRIWLKKEKAYSDLRFDIIAPSRWMAGSVAKSKLLGTRQVFNIPNTLDIDVFKPIPKEEARRSLGLPAGKFILMSGFMPSRKDLHKGTPYLLEAIEIFMRDHQADYKDVEMVIFGNREHAELPETGVHTAFLGTISSEQRLALCYSAADVFIAPSLEDNLPYTVMESLACGTPVVAFTTGGIPDMVQHKYNGYLAEYRSPADLAAGIGWVYKHPQSEIPGLNARKYIEENFSEDIVARKHIELYTKLINEHVQP